jgi:large subunit ribosomal protein L31
VKPDIHPKYRFVVFRDISNNTEFLTRSCVNTSDKTTLDGEEYPLFTTDISSTSHPFYTGQQKLMDVEGRVDRFYRKYGFKAESAEGEQA